MPGGDRSGPIGQGPRTGRAMGFCAGYDRPGSMSPGPGLGLGRGMGRMYNPRGGMFRGQGGRGMRRFAPIPYAWDPWGGVEISKDQELQMLKNQSEQLSNELSEMEKRIKELEGKKS